jgi:hypothetical protein
MGGGQVTVDRETFDLTPLVTGTIDRFLVASQADCAHRRPRRARSVYLFLDGGEVRRAPAFPAVRRPARSEASACCAMSSAMSRSSPVRPLGETRGFSLFLDPRARGRPVRPHQAVSRRNRRAVDVSSRPARATRPSSSARGGTPSLVFSTNETVRWQKDLDFPSPRRSSAASTTAWSFSTRRPAALLPLHDPHPEAAPRLFRQALVRGQPGPPTTGSPPAARTTSSPSSRSCRSSSARSRARFYALLFAVPIALLAATYTSQFLSPEMKVFVKPPWRSWPRCLRSCWASSPRSGSRPSSRPACPRCCCIVVLMPLTALVFGWAWTQLPPRVRLLIPPGWEFLVFRSDHVPRGLGRPGRWVPALERICGSS